MSQTYRISESDSCRSCISPCAPFEGIAEDRVYQSIVTHKLFTFRSNIEDCYGLAEVVVDNQDAHEERRALEVMDAQDQMQEMKRDSKEVE